MLAAKLARASAADDPLRLAIVGIGNELRGDDAAGVSFVRAFKRLTSPRASSVLVIDAGTAPENYTGPLRAFKPELVLLVDAAQLNERPGTVLLLEAAQTGGLDASTHTLPPYLIARYLTAELGCEIVLLGIQPADNTLGAPLSPRVRSACTRAARELDRLVHQV